MRQLLRLLQLDRRQTVEMELLLLVLIAVDDLMMMIADDWMMMIADDWMMMMMMVQLLLLLLLLLGTMLELQPMLLLVFLGTS